MVSASEYITAEQSVYNLRMTPQNVSLPCDQDGNVLDFLPAGNRNDLYYGSELVDPLTYTKKHITQNCTIEGDGFEGFTIESMTADTASVTVEAYIGTKMVASATMSITKVKDGGLGPMPMNAGIYSPTVTYERTKYAAPYVHYTLNGKDLWFLMVREGRIMNVDPFTDTSNFWWQHKEFYDIVLARKIQAYEIDTENLTAAKVSTGKTGARVEVQGSMINIFGDIARNIQIGVSEQGYAVLAYYDNSGNKIYDLGPNGINWGSIVPSSWSKTRLTLVCSLMAGDAIPLWNDVSMVVSGITNTTGRDYYKYYAGSNPTITEAEREKEKYLYLSQNTLGNKIADGWYTNSFTLTPMWASDETGQYITPDPDGIYEFQFGGVLDQNPIYFRELTEYKDGKPIRRRNVIWNGTIKR